MGCEGCDEETILSLIPEAPESTLLRYLNGPNRKVRRAARGELKRRGIIIHHAFTRRAER